MKLSKLYLMKNRHPQIWGPIILTMFWLSICTTLEGQKLDSLRAQLRNSNTTTRCTTLYGIAYELIDVDNISALEYASKSIECAILQRDTLLLIRATRIKALAFSRLGERDSAYLSSLSVLSLARRKESPELHHILHSLGVELNYKGRYDEALQYLFETLEIRQRIATPAYLASSLNSIGVVYYKLRDYHKAIEYYTLALEQCKLEHGDDRQTALTLVNISLCYAYIGELDKADSTVVIAEQFCKDACLPVAFINIPFCRGVVALGRRDTTDGKSQFLESYRRAKEDENERLELDNIVYLSQIFLATNDIGDAAKYLQIAEDLIHKGVFYNMELMKVYNEFARLYEKKRDYKMVAEFQRRYIVFRDSTQNEEMTLGLMQVEANHVEKEKNAKIESQNMMLALNEEIISRQRIASIFEFSTIVLLIGGVVLLVRSVREKKSRNVDLEKRVKNRTADLESIVKQSQKTLSEKKIWVEKILSSVKHTSNTINGLSALAVIDPESRERCALLIQDEMTQLVTEVNSYASRSDSGNGV